MVVGYLSVIIGGAVHLGATAEDQGGVQRQQELMGVGGWLSEGDEGRDVVYSGIIWRAVVLACLNP